MTINVRKAKLENMYWRPDRCPRVVQLLDLYMKTPSYRTNHDQIAKLYRKLSLSPVPKHACWYDFVSTVGSLLAHGHGLPAPFTEQDVQNVYSGTLTEIPEIFTPEVSKLCTGRFLGEVFDGFVKGPSFSLYSAHDHTILPILRLLNPEALVDHPTFASCMLMEVYEDVLHKRQYCKVIYNGEEFPLLVPKDTNGLYPLDELKKSIVGLITSDEEEIDACREKP